MPGSCWGGQSLGGADLESRIPWIRHRGFSSPVHLEIVRAMTYVINQGLALYWGTSRWSAAEIMVRDSDTPHPTVTVRRSRKMGGLL